MDQVTKRKRRENLRDMWQRLTKLNECDASGRCQGKRWTTVFGKTPLIIDYEMWFIVNTGLLKFFPSLSEADNSITAFSVLLNELKEANPFVLRSLLSAS